MSSPAEFYKSLPPISKAYGTACLLFTVAYQLGLYHPADIALLYELVLSRFQSEIWSATGEWTFPKTNSRFSVDDDIWSFDIIGILLAMGHAGFRCYLWFTNYARSLGDHCWTSLLLLNRVASTCYREELAEDTNLGVSFLLQHKLVMRWRIGAPTGTPAQPDNLGAAFRGRSYRVGGATAYPAQPDRGSGVATTNPVQPDNGPGVAFRGRSYRLGG
ncbi:hypothetical protein H5410_027487 [Solanum commersonii]|uniref:Uncharacterized protein n=1 Tax=Solanum commersonii TaxID=4109 RepID=A0A9J5YZA6_SOLCO|nr:hypothetical protein H5410_027487 [Solanum commersonii]